jgi:hypothetical protein
LKPLRQIEIGIQIIGFDRHRSEALTSLGLGATGRSSASC